MTVTTVYATNGGHIHSYNGSYAQNRAGTANFYVDTVGWEGEAGQYDTGFCEDFLDFNTGPVIPDTDAIAGAVLYVYTGGCFKPVAYTVEARLHDWGTTLTSADFVAGDALSGKTLLATLASSAVASYDGAFKGYSAFTSDIAFRDNISKTGNTRLFLSTSRQRIGNAPSSSEYLVTVNYLYTGTSLDPYLVIYHAPPRTTIASSVSFATLPTKLQPRKLDVSPASASASASSARMSTLHTPYFSETMVRHYGVKVLEQDQ